MRVLYYTYSTYLHHKSIDIFLFAPWKPVLWVLIEVLLMSTHNTGFHGEIQKNTIWIPPLNWSYESLDYKFIPIPICRFYEAIKVKIILVHHFVTANKFSSQDYNKTPLVFHLDSFFFFHYWTIASFSIETTVFAQFSTPAPISSLSLFSKKNVISAPSAIGGKIFTYLK